MKTNRTNMRSRDFVLFETIWFFLLITGTTAATTDGPSNTVAEIGQQVNLSCTAENAIKWVLSKDGSSNGQLSIAIEGCMVNIGFEDHYATESLNSGKSCNLIVFDITMEQAGVYKCMPTGESYFSSILTVIDSPPVVTVNTTEALVQGEKVLMECSLAHNGSTEPAPTLRPYFLWQNKYRDNISSSYDSTTENTALSRITVTAGHNNISSYTCHVYLQLIPSTDPGYANNIPSVNSSAITPIIEVLYRVQVNGFSKIYPKITIDGTVCGLVTITCVVDANPAPSSYEWFSYNVWLSNDATLEMVETGREYTCVANNTIGNESYSDNHTSRFFPYPQDCKCPRNESTWIYAVVNTDCDAETCACSEVYDSFTLTCTAESYPNASYQWIGPDNRVLSNSQVLTNVTSNGMYHCIAYFDQSTSNYTGDHIFPNGTSVRNVIECTKSISTSPTPTLGSTTSMHTSNACSYHPVASSSHAVAIAMGVLFGISLADNIAILIIWIWNRLRAKQDPVKKSENVLQPEMMDLSNGTSVPRTYQELSRHDASQLNQDTLTKN